MTRINRPQSFLLITLLTMSSLMVSGCYSRRRLAAAALEGSKPILAGYRRYVTNDGALTDADKRLRLETVEAFEATLQEGAQ